MTELQQGFWHSNLSEEQAISASTDYTQLECSQRGDLYWLEQRPDQQGRNLLCTLLGGEVIEITAEGYSVQSRVHEYGGRSWCLCADSLVFVNATDQQLYGQSASMQEQPKAITAYPNSRFIEPLWDARRNRILAVEEIHGQQAAPQAVENRLVAIDLTSKELKILHQGFDFYAYADITDNTLAFISWMHPEQPWTSTQLHLAYLDDSGQIETLKAIAGVQGGESVSQPFFNQQTLNFISDRSGWWNIYAYTDEAEIKPLQQSSADVMPAPWQSGLKSYVCQDQDLIWVEQQHKGARLMHNGADITPVGYTQFRSLAASEESIYCVAAGPEELPQLISVDKKSSACKVLHGVQHKSSIAQVPKLYAKPLAMTFGSRNKCYGYFYPATNATYESKQPAPLVIFLHGGPTASTYPVLNFKIQYWTQRGFTVLDLNYRGSSGYGRNYRMQLRGQWGVIEVEDIQACVAQLIEEKRVAPKAIFIRGNSSGGYSALNAMCELDCFAGGASLYGVTDPLSLSTATHKFESKYLDWLIGDPVREQEKYAKLAPINKAAQIHCPVIFFQGEQDRVVVPEQTRAMLAQLQAQGVTSRGVFFTDEAHGFRKKANQVQVLKDELSFYQEILLQISTV